MALSTEYHLLVDNAIKKINNSEQLKKKSCHNKDIQNN